MDKVIGKPDGGDIKPPTASYKVVREYASNFGKYYVQVEVSGQGAVSQYTQVASAYIGVGGFCPCDANGDIYFATDAAVGSQMGTKIEIWGYYI
jgi:hypothetical protein